MAVLPADLINDLNQIDANGTPRASLHVGGYDFSPAAIHAAFSDFIHSHGYEVVRDWKPKGTGEETRLKLPTQRREDSSARARLYTDKPAQGWIEDFHGDFYEWRYLDWIGADKTKSETYRRELPNAQEQEKIKAARQAAEAAERLEAERSARELYNRALPYVNGSPHGYLDRKHVQAHEGIRRNNREILVPLYRLDDLNTVINVQRIDESGGKLFMGGCRAAGAVYIIGTPAADKPIGLAEGYATAASVHEATGLPVVMCCNCHNLATVAKSIKQYIKAADYLIFADNDAETATRASSGHKNPGLSWAKTAAEALGVDAAHIIAPKSVDGQNIDWNDRAQQISAQELAQELHEAIENATQPVLRAGYELLDRLKPMTAERARELATMRGEGIELGWTFYTVQGQAVSLKCQALTLIGARTGGGKTLTLANIAARVLEKYPQKHVLFISLEESEESAYFRTLAAYLGGRLPHSITVEDIETSVMSGGASLHPYYTEAYNKILAGMDELETRLLTADLINLEEVERADATAALITAFCDKYGKENAVICLDYIQLVKPEAEAQGNYRDFKNVVEIIKTLTRQKVVIFAGAQFNREGARSQVDAATEFFTEIPEHLREAADLEQAAEIVIYAKIDGDNYRMNFRVLKNRRGVREITNSMPAQLERGFLDWTGQERASFATPADYTDGGEGARAERAAAASSETTSAVKVTPAQRFALDALERAAIEQGETDENGHFSGVSLEHWKAAYFDMAFGEMTAAERRRAFAGAGKALKEKKLIEVTDGGLYTFPNDAQERHLIINDKIKKRREEEKQKETQEAEEAEKEEDGDYWLPY